MRRVSIAIALLAVMWFAAPVLMAEAAPCLIVTLTGTQAGPSVFNGQAGAGTLVRYGDDDNTAAELASIKAETLSHWMGWSGEPYETFQRLVRKAEAGLESRMVTILTGQAEVRPELALAILERKFPQRWAKVTVVAAPPQHLSFNVADILQKVQERIAQGNTQGQLPHATIINAPVKAAKPHDPRPPRLAVVSDLPGNRLHSSMGSRR
jgi:hypothetical protein